MPPKDYTGLDSGVLNEEIIMHSTIETVDHALFKWVEELNIHTETNRGWKKVGVLWVTAERSFQTKHNKELRDANGILNVSASDKATSKEQSIRIEASTGLTEEEIEKMKIEAEKHAKEDENKKESVDIHNNADKLIYQTES